MELNIIFEWHTLELICGMKRLSDCSTDNMLPISSVDVSLCTNVDQ